MIMCLPSNTTSEILMYTFIFTSKKQENDVKRKFAKNDVES